jgi:hypothetical protein
MNDFKFLTKAQVAALSDADAATYAAALAAYVKQFKIDNPTSTATVRLDIERLGIIPNTVNGSPRVSFSFDADDVDATITAALAVGEKRDTILLPVGRAHVIAQQSGFAHWGHMGTAINNLLDSGSFTVDVRLCVEGEAWTGKKNGKKTAGTYTSTHLAIVGFTYVPSVVASATTQRMAEKAATVGYVDMMNASIVKPKAVVADGDDEDGDDGINA